MNAAETRLRNREPQPQGASPALPNKAWKHENHMHQKSPGVSESFKVSLVTICGPFSCCFILLWTALSSNLGLHSDARIAQELALAGSGSSQTNAGHQIMSKNESGRPSPPAGFLVQQTLPQCRTSYNKLRPHIANLAAKGLP